MYKLALFQSLPLIGQPSALTRGFTGQGARVAVVDTRIDHRWRDPDGLFAFGAGCASGVGSPDCAIVASYDAAGGEPEDPSHGTNVAGISWQVAPQSGIVGVDVFRQVDGSALAFSPDIIAGLNWVLNNWRQ
ncbi:MAG: hypothetical protein N3C12_14605 [Candidatus Binatia bacterium]|nr:hypothetical protein [Candidatus Binatia bacterium]